MIPDFTEDRKKTTTKSVHYTNIYKKVHPKTRQKYMQTKTKKNRTLKILNFNPSYPEGGVIIILCQKIAISAELNLHWTSDQSVNSSLCVVVQKKKNRALFLS